MDARPLGCDPTSGRLQHRTSHRQQADDQKDQRGGQTPPVGDGESEAHERTSNGRDGCDEMKPAVRRSAERGLDRGGDDDGGPAREEGEDETVSGAHGRGPSRRVKTRVPANERGTRANGAIRYELWLAA